MDTNQHSPEYFSISEGGPAHNAFVKMRLHKNQKKLILVFLCVTWLPLVIITAIDGTLYSGVQLPFLKDIAMQMRLLVALPILLLIKFIIDGKVIDLEKYFFYTLMSDNEQRLTLIKIFNRTRKLANSILAEIIMLLIVIAATISFVKTGFFSGLQSGTESWMSNEIENHTLSVAGKWVVFISIPVFQFLLLRWIWRYIVWVLHLSSISRSRLNLQPTHPDRAGGLGIIVHTQKYFSLVFVGFSIVVSGEMCAHLLRDPEAFPGIRGEVIGCIIICLFLLLLPMVFFTGKLIKTKHDGLLKLSNLGASMSNKFEEDWINDKPIENKVAERSVGTSMLYDYSGVYRSLEELRPVPITLKDVISMAAILFIPYIPIVFIHFSVGELLQKLVGLLL
jgi:hypothetical protein